MNVNGHNNGECLVTKYEWIYYIWYSNQSRHKNHYFVETVFFRLSNIFESKTKIIGNWWTERFILHNCVMWSSVKMCIHPTILHLAIKIHEYRKALESNSPALSCPSLMDCAIDAVNPTLGYDLADVTLYAVWLLYLPCVQGRDLQL